MPIGNNEQVSITATFTSPCVPLGLISDDKYRLLNEEWL